MDIKDISIALRAISFLDDTVLPRPLDDFGDVAEGEARHGVGAAVVDGDAAALGVVNLGAREANVGHIARQLILFLRRNEVRTRTIDGLPRLFEVEQGRSEAVNVAVAGAKHAVVEQQPALAGLYGHRTGADFHALPCAYLEGGRAHHVAMATPELHVGAFAVEDVAERCVTGVGRTRHHGEVAVDLLGEEYAVAVVGKESVFELMEGLEVLRPRDTDGRPVVTVAPSHVVAVFNEAHAGVVAIHPLADFGIVALETQRFLVDIPVHAVLREAHMEHHAAVGVVATEHTGVAFAERNHGAIEDTVARGQQIAWDNGVF